MKARFTNKCCRNITCAFTLKLTKKRTRTLTFMACVHAFLPKPD